MLSANYISYDPLTSAVVIQGTPEDDVVRVWTGANERVNVRMVTSGESFNASFDRPSVALIRFYGGDGDDDFHNQTDIPTWAWGGDGNDRLIGGSGNDRLFGGPGDDVLSGGDGDDELHGEDGNDRLHGGAGNDKLFGGLGNDRLFGGEGDDLLVGGEGDDELRGEEGNDQLYGGPGNDLLVGGPGDDWLYGGSGDDVLHGNDGNDRLFGEAGNDRLYGGAGNDLLDGGPGHDKLYGGAGDDVLRGGDGDDELYGEDGNDRLYGGPGNDLLVGGPGNDWLYGGSGDDVLRGNDGDDRLFGEEGNDRLFGGAGNDRLYGGPGDDVLYGGDGDDILWGGEGNDVLYGEAGNDILFGEDGNDLLFGGPGHDVLVGGPGDDILEGGSGNDILIGGAGADVLRGQAGDDILIGGTTAYDNDLESLRALLKAWSSASAYSARIELLESHDFVAPLLSARTVFDDGAADVLIGGDGQDWFFQTGFMGVYVPSDVGRDAHAGSHHHGHSGPIILDRPPELEGFEFISAIDHVTDRQSDESLHSLLPHSDDPVLQREHLTLFELVRYDQITHYAVQSGDWSNPATWHNGTLPAFGARVLIPLGVEVRVDGVITAPLFTVRVDGTLSFETTRSTSLRVDTLVVSDTGAFVMGTAAAPVDSNVTARLVIADWGPIDRAKDPFALGRGLLSHGRVSIHGASISSHVALAGPVLAGSQILTLKQTPFRWKTGDTLIIAGTTDRAQQNEVRRIQLILGNTVLLDRPLDFDHLPPRDDLEVHVANVTRNAVIESQSAELDRRGHVMFMHSRNVDVAYAGFYRLGRTNKLERINDPVVNDDWSLADGTGTNPRGRYSVHFHRTGLTNDGNPSLVVGSAVVDSPGWGFVNHSSFVEMTANVAFDVRGAAFVTEVGDEIGSFRRNIAIGTTGSSEAINSRQNIHDFGHRGDGFWFQGVGIYVTENIAAGNTGSAFFYYARAIAEDGVVKEFRAANLPDPSLAGGADSIAISSMPLFQFENNVGYASGQGLSTRYLMETADERLFSFLRDSVFWNNNIGISIPYSRQIVLENLTVLYVKQQPDEPTPQHGINLNSLTRDITYNNLTVRGYVNGIVVPRRGYSVVNGGDFSNARDMWVLSGAGRHALITGITQPLRIVMTLDLSGNIGNVTHVLEPDVVILNYGPFQNQRLYYTQQQADTVVFSEPYDGVPPEYVGLTNQQLWDSFGVALGGAVAPSDAYTVHNIVGLVGPAA